MKKVLSTILPSVLIFLFIFIDSHFPYSKWILIGIYILFPIMFIIQTIISFKSIKNMLAGFLLLSLSIILPIDQWYKIGSIMPAIIVYLVLSLITYLLIEVIDIIKRNKKITKNK
ncbi:hypothetical protein AXY43_06595 [Clostridium sp. MF28]|uniref:DUF2651 domain-containing protein n=1 Tax=Clostridium diolis TaxID=223919 RepID=A0AAV3W4M4_9CLOT|nr:MULTISPECIES: hypothetical protein [Clostridium]ALB45121.1 hypothetical protein X276_07460 [Clostridium beijerinckii NRRL B-598]AVK47728.1 hypothetical protein AXY43_06595 [Clostridium sp. MF28]OVE65847.1 hypothetical protein CCS79_21050 [Clostridium diolis]PSM56592.1 hypothetical protein C4L39_16900 [Clostridium diolis]QES74741.1 hypothetical protein F3K33_18850 [Clostridium diolis]